MTLEEIFINLNLDDNKNFLSIETFILNLLRIHQEKNGKTLVIGQQFGFDAFAEKGIEEIEGPTIVEIKFNLDRMSPIRIFDLIGSIENRASRVFNEQVKNILIISPTNITERTKRRIIDLENYSKVRNINLFFWSEKEVNKIISQNKKDVPSILNNLFSLRIESAVRETSKNWKEEREERIATLKSFFKKGQLSLFLGAGVSSSTGMPDWNTLINSLFVTYITNEFGKKSNLENNDLIKIVNRLNEIDGQSALMSARYLRKGLDKNTTESKEFKQIITNNLYSLRNNKYSLDSELIKAIASMCLPRRTGAKIKSVVTYNFDDLIERQLKNQSIQYYSIFSDTDILDPDDLPIYHVHGFLPEKPEEYEFLEKSTLVFSEEGYHQIYSDSYHWSNLVQLSQLRENHCLMVGLSMTDPNLRRLLEISSRNTDKPRHFAFLKRLEDRDFIYNQSEKVIDNEESAIQFLNKHHRLNEELMRELGIIVIWYTNYDEIPHILNKIK